MKFLHIEEYSALSNNLPKNHKYSFKLGDSIIYTSVISADTKEQIKENYEQYQVYNDNVIENTIVPLNDVIIYDNLDIKDSQKIAYVFECPICLYKVITSDKDLFYCPQCENTEFPFNLVALINIDQMEDLAIENSDVTTLAIVKDGELEILDKKE